MKKIKEDVLMTNDLSKEDLELIKQVDQMLDKDVLSKDTDVKEDGGMTSAGVLGVNSTADGFMDGKTNFVMPKKLSNIDNGEEVEILRRISVEESSKKKKSASKKYSAVPYWFPREIDSDDDSDIDITDTAMFDAVADGGMAVGESDEEDDESFE